MKYIRTKDNIYELTNEKISVDFVVYYYVKGKNTPISSEDIIKQADTIEELCDEFVVIFEDGSIMIEPNLSTKQGKYIKYGAIWTDKGLLYVARINSEGKLELI